MDELIYRQAAIDVLNDGAELWRRVLDEPDVVGIERKKYEWGLDLIESYISDMKELPPAQPDWDEMIVMCDCCGHAIHVKRTDVERKSDA